MEGIEVKDVCKIYYDQNGKPFNALNNISFTWNLGENLAVIGESGSGKSTLARLLIGIEKPSFGKIIVFGKDTSKWGYSIWRKHRSQIQAVFQDASGTLNPTRSVYHNVEEALCNFTNLNKKQRELRIFGLMELTGMKRDLLKIPTRQLSGGEQRRLSLLRALSIYPKFLILDEVTSGLDILSAHAVLSVLEKYHTEHGCAYLLITHDKQNAYRLTKHIFQIRKGKFIKEGFKDAEYMQKIII